MLSESMVTRRAGRPTVEAWRWSWRRLPVAVGISRFVGEGGVAEHHLTFYPTREADFLTQLGWLEEAWRLALADLGADPAGTCFRRFFCSDPVNQVGLAAAWAAEQGCGSRAADSWIGQPPVPPARVALWAGHLSDPAGPLVRRDHADGVVWQRGELTHHWTAGLACPEAAGSAAQTAGVFGRYEAYLASHGLTLPDHVVRTWLYVQNVDANYQGLVDARRELFAARGMTAATHYIASTGIEGRAADVRALVTLAAYAIGGLRPGMVRHLSAPDYLSPTALYGVTFERATEVRYRDRRQVFLSGTASIDHRGEIVHPGDVGRQLDRTVTNLSALLAQADSGLADLNVTIAYLRDTCDAPLVAALLAERCGETPGLLVTAPVCRPGWLVEVEGQAVVADEAPELPEY